MIMRVRKSHIAGQTEAIISKSFAHRIAICNFLAGNGSILDCGDFYSQDINATLNCLKTLKSGGRVLDCGESGSTLRFMLPLVGALGGEFELVGHGKLMQRPNEQLICALEAHGVKVSQGESIKVEGKLTSGEFKLRGDVSSQYITGLLMALPLLKGDSTIVLTTPAVSTGYIDITLQVLKAYGIEPEIMENGYKIKGGACFKGSAAVEGDWSNAAPFLVMGALFDKVSVKGLNLQSVQGDRVILDILKMAGAKVDVSDNIVSVSPAKLKPFTVDAQNCPDLVPVVGALGAFIEGQTQIYGVERLKIKESDRIESTIATLKGFGINAIYDNKKITIYGSKPRAGQVDSFNDHRIVMAATVLGLGADGQSQILGYKAINKSFPQFFDCVKDLGGEVDEL